MVGFLILLVIFRSFLSSLSGFVLSSGSILAASTLCLFVTIALSCKWSTLVKLKKDPIQKIFLANIGTLLVFIVISHFTNGIDYTINAIKILSPVNLFWAFTGFLFFSRMSQFDTIKLLDNICLITVSFFACDFFLEYLGNKAGFTHREYFWKKFYYGLDSVKDLDNKTFYYYGLLGHPHLSLSIIASGTAYLLGRVRLVNFKGYLQYFAWLGSLLFGVTSVMIAQSLIATIALLLVIFGWISLQIIYARKFWLLIIAGVLVTFVFFISPAYTELIGYIQGTKSKSIQEVLPVVSGCDWSILFSKFPDRCSIGEFHVFGNAVKFGLWVIVFPLLLILIPLIFGLIGVLRSKKNKNILAPTMLLSYIIISSIHYVPVFTWGNNLLGLLASVCIYKIYEEKS